eukprot:COSAG05_NODE_3_length_51333_cov_129.132080_21_plen_1016_part_00
MAAARQHAGDDHGWSREFQRLLEAEPVPATLVAALVPLDGAGLLMLPKDVASVSRALEAKRPHMLQMLEAEGVADYRLDFALALWLYTTDEAVAKPPVYRFLNAELRAFASSGVVTGRLRACLPLVKFFEAAMHGAPQRYCYQGKCHRGVKLAWGVQGVTNVAADHNPAAWYPRGCEFGWGTFDSASTKFDTMHDAEFCGLTGPRTIFTIEGVFCLRIEKFSAFPTEEEVLFPPSTRFRVEGCDKRLRPDDLQAGAAGGFPDEVRLGPCVAEAVPPQLMLESGREAIDLAVLGRGTFADVYRGTYHLPGHEAPTPTAFKIFRDTSALDNSHRQQIAREAQLGMQLRHPNLIRLYGVLEVPTRGLSLVLELAAGGSLRSVLSDRARFPEIPWAVRARWMMGIAKGMHELHRVPMVHRDLKAANVLMSSLDVLDENTLPQIADFGVSKMMDTVARTTSSGRNTGTLAWKAPETFKGHYSAASDVFGGMGVTGFEVVTRNVPWQAEGVSQPEINRLALMAFQYTPAWPAPEAEQRQIWDGDNPLRTRRPDLDGQVEVECPARLKAMVESCWVDDPNERLTTEQCIAELNGVIEDILGEQAAAAVALRLAEQAAEVARLEAEQEAARLAQEAEEARLLAEARAAEAAEALRLRSEQARAAPRWVPDAEAQNCLRCDTGFSFFIPKHHCRYCGWVVCAECSQNTLELERTVSSKPPHEIKPGRYPLQKKKVCDGCFEHAQAEMAPRIEVARAAYEAAQANQAAEVERATAAKAAERKAAADKKVAEKQAKLARVEALSKRRKALGLGFFATEADCVKKETEIAEEKRRAAAAREKVAKEKAAREKAAREKVAREKAAREKVAREKAAREKAARDKAKARRQKLGLPATASEAQCKAAEKAAREKVAREKAAREKVAREKAAREKVAREKAAREKAARDKAKARRQKLGLPATASEAQCKAAEKAAREKAKAAGAVLCVEGAGTADFNGYYKEKGAPSPFPSVIANDDDDDDDDDDIMMMI